MYAFWHRKTNSKYPINNKLLSNRFNESDALALRALFGQQLSRSVVKHHELKVSTLISKYLVLAWPIQHSQPAFKTCLNAIICKQFFYPKSAKQHRCWAQCYFGPAKTYTKSIAILWIVNCLFKKNQNLVEFTKWARLTIVWATHF